MHWEARPDPKFWGSSQIQEFSENSTKITMNFSAIFKIVQKLPKKNFWMLPKRWKSSQKLHRISKYLFKTPPKKAPEKLTIFYKSSELFGNQKSFQILERFQSGDISGCTTCNANSTYVRADFFLICIYCIKAILLSYRYKPIFRLLHKGDSFWLWSPLTGSLAR